MRRGIATDDEDAEEEPVNSKLDDRLLTLQELADYLGVSASTIYNRRYRGENMPRSIRVGGRVRYRQSDVLDWLEAQADELPRPAA